MKNKLYIVFSILFCIATLFMGVGYASINSISLNVTGDVQPQLQNGIYITSVEYLNSNYVDINKSKIINAYQNNLNSNIVLSENPNSSITYKVTIYNSTNTDYVFERIKLLKCAGTEACNTYSNNNIQITTNVEKGELISSKDFLVFNITFSYVDLNNIDNIELNSIINFLFTDADKTYLLRGTELNAKIKNASNSNMVDSTVNKVIFGKYSDYSSVVSWSNYESFVDENQLGDIRLFRINKNNETTVYILSNGPIYANSKSDRSFQNLSAMVEIEFDNYNTTQIMDMTRMFYMFSEDTSQYASSLKSLDLSNWDVYNVVNMRAMFGYNTVLEYLDISTWETENCTNMGYMFQEIRTLSELNITNFDTSNVTTMQGMFLGFTGAEILDLSSFDTSKVTVMTNMFDSDSYHTVLEYTTVLKTIYVSNKFTVDSILDKSTTMFKGNINLVGGNGTKFNEEAIDVNYAVIDNAVYDQNGNYISGKQGYFTLKK